MSDATGSDFLAEAEPKRRVMIYTPFERFWHWSQAVLIFILAITGFSVHGMLPMNYELAVKVHSYTAIVLILLWVFTTFWHFTTNQWRQYLPKMASLWAVIRFYAWGILTGAPHPYTKTLKRKQNALQSLAYLTFMVVIGPALWASGLVYILFPVWANLAAGTAALPVIAFIHTAAAWMMVIFVLIHVYMTTTGKTAFHYIGTMISGYDTIPLSKAHAAYLKEQEPGRLK